MSRLILSKLAVVAAPPCGPREEICVHCTTAGCVCADLFSRSAILPSFPPSFHSYLRLAFLISSVFISLRSTTPSGATERERERDREREGEGGEGEEEEEHNIMLQSNAARPASLPPQTETIATE